MKKHGETFTEALHFIIIMMTVIIRHHVHSLGLQPVGLVNISVQNWQLFLRGSPIRHQEVFTLPSPPDHKSGSLHAPEGSG